MNVIINNLFTQRDSQWIQTIDHGVKPHIVMLWLMMIDPVRKYTRWLDIYAYRLNDKMFLSLAWSILPKMERAPFFKYIEKQKKSTDPLEPLYVAIKKEYSLGRNDWIYIKPRIEKNINKNKLQWFMRFAIDKKYYKLNGLNFEEVKTAIKTDTKKKTLFDF